MKTAILNAIIIIAIFSLLPGVFAQFVAGGFDSGFTPGGFDSGFTSGGFDSGFTSGGFDSNLPLLEPSAFQPVAQSSGISAPAILDNNLPESFDATTLQEGLGTQPAQPLTAVWNPLQDVVISQASPDGTIIYPHITSQCHDPGSQFLQFAIESTSPHFNLFFLDGDLIISELNPTFVGSETITLTCNGVPASFQLTVRALQKSSQQTIDKVPKGGKPRVHIHKIIIPDNARPGDNFPVTVVLEDVGGKKIEDAKINVYLPELGVRAPQASSFDFDRNVRSQRLIIELPDYVIPGTYALLIAVDAHKLHRRIYREIEIV